MSSVGPWLNAPPPSPRRIRTLFEPVLTAARSRMPSELKSPARQRTCASSPADRNSERECAVAVSLHDRDHPVAARYGNVEFAIPIEVADRPKRRIVAHLIPLRQPRGQIVCLRNKRSVADTPINHHHVRIIQGRRSGIPSSFISPTSVA